MSEHSINDTTIRKILSRNGFDPDREASLFQYLLFVVLDIIPYDLTPEEETYIHECGKDMEESQEEQCTTI